MLRRVLYFTDTLSGRISRASLDGSNVVVLQDGLLSPYGLALDIPTQTLYWADFAGGMVQSSSVNGQNTTVLDGSASGPVDVAYDSNSNTLFYTSLGSGDVLRIDIAGGNASNVLVLSEPRGLEVVDPQKQVAGTG